MQDKNQISSITSNQIMDMHVLIHNQSIKNHYRNNYINPFVCVSLNIDDAYTTIKFCNTS